MDVIVCVKRVPDVGDAGPEVSRTGREIATAGLAWGINEWDDVAVEEALRIREAHGGTVTAITVGEADCEEVLRRALAMGADEALHLRDPAFPASDPRAVATILQRAIAARRFDLILTGAVTSDGGSGNVGPMLAALLDVPHVPLATTIEIEGRTVRVQHEVEAGLERVVEVDLPALITVQTGLNEPRYVPIRGIRKVAGVAIPTLDAAAVGLAGTMTGESVQLDSLVPPPPGKGGEILRGRPEEIVEGLIARLRERGGLER